MAIRFIRETSGGSDLVDNSRRAYTTSALVEMLRYLILAVPDTFVALDCFPLPSCVVTHVVNDGISLRKLTKDSGMVRNGLAEIERVPRDGGLEVRGQPLSIDCVVSSIQKRSSNLARATRPGHPGHNVAKAVQALDKVLIDGDVTVAYKFLFEELYDGAVDGRWLTEVSPCLRSSLKWIGSVSLSLTCSLFFICEWATCDFRDFRTTRSNGLKLTGRRDFSQVYIAVRLLKLTMRNMQISLRSKINSSQGVDDLMGGTGSLNNLFGRTSPRNLSELKSKLKSLNGKRKELSSVFQSPGPLHDIIVCWIDQHESQDGEGFKRLQLLIIELTRSGIFYPQAYVRQLIVSGLMDQGGPMADVDRRKRHYKILKQLPAPYICDALEEAKVIQAAVLSEAMNIYSNERRLLLRGLNVNQKGKSRAQKQKSHLNYVWDTSYLSPVDQRRSMPSASSLSSRENVKNGVQLEELKASISVLLKFPTSSSASIDTGLDDPQGTLKRPIGSIGLVNDHWEGTPGCEECKRVKRQKLSEEKSYLVGHSPNPLDDEEMWWARKGQKADSFRADPPVKPAKQAPRGRQKLVRKTQSLAQLAAARIEGSQGASTSHLCDNRISCPHHRSGNDVVTPKSIDGTGAPHAGDIVSIGNSLKKLRFVEKRVISVWLIATARQLVEDAEKTDVKAGQFTRSLPAVDDRISMRWKLGEDELSAILYLMDISNDVVSAAKFLLLLLPKVTNSLSSSIHGGRNSHMLSRSVENHACAIGETFLISALKRFLFINLIMCLHLLSLIFSTSSRFHL